MSRVSVGDPRIQNLVQDRLGRLFLARGSVNGVSECLNAALKRCGSSDVLYPNRLHAILGTELGRTVNEATLRALEAALQGTPEKDLELSPEAAARATRWKNDLIRFWKNSNEDIEKTLALAKTQLALPGNVAIQLLKDLGFVTGAQDSAFRGVRLATKSPDIEPFAGDAPRPDWSFQDVAVTRAIDFFLRKPTGKAGIVIPTAGGKTRVALRVGLEMLNKASNENARVFWVTHRKNLRNQARRDLQEMLNDGGHGLPEDSAELLATRFEFIMVSAVEQVLSNSNASPTLIIIDEGHHAAAASYDPIFENRPQIPALIITATPRRTDERSIRIDEVVYHTTYQELVRRGVILRPEFRDLPVSDFNWEDDSIDNFVEELLDGCRNEYRKVLLICPRVELVEKFFNGVIQQIRNDPSHPLTESDIGYIHSNGNSLGSGIGSEEFLSTFKEKPKAILISAQMLLEGFNDRSIDTVCITYPSQSKIVLMQAAGRAVRWAPGKKKAYVIQARNDDLQYHFEERWLYEEIDDFLKPKLLDIEFRDHSQFLAAVEQLLVEHNVRPERRESILSRLKTGPQTAKIRILLGGLPYYGDLNAFETCAEWTALLETDENTKQFRDIFNVYCEVGANHADLEAFLAMNSDEFGVYKATGRESSWAQYIQMLRSMTFARDEIYGSGRSSSVGAYRPKQSHTTWLKYVAFHYRPDLPTSLENFLADCYNLDELRAQYASTPNKFKRAIKIPLPVEKFEGFLLDDELDSHFLDCINQLRNSMNGVSHSDQLAEYSAFIERQNQIPLPVRVLKRLDHFLNFNFKETINLELNQLGPSGRLKTTTNMEQQKDA